MSTTNEIQTAPIRPRRRGWMRLLTVIVSIIVLLGILLVPAVRDARIAATRMADS